MRIYKDFREATNEIRRDLAEMGILVHPHSYQDVDVRGNQDFDTLELQNYIYTVTQPDAGDLTPTQPWASLELGERILGMGKMNPGNAWRSRPEVWTEFLRCPPLCEPNISDGCSQDPTTCGYSKFSYTYDERMHYQLDTIANELKANPETRQAFLSVWNPKLDARNIGGLKRVPCTLGYIFQMRRGQLHMTYMMRSSDFVTHFQNDVYLAYRLQQWMADQVKMPVGHFTHYVASLHVFRKDVEGVF